MLFCLLLGPIFSISATIPEQQKHTLVDFLPFKRLSALNGSGSASILIKPLWISRYAAVCVCGDSSGYTLSLHVSAVKPQQ